MRKILNKNYGNFRNKYSRNPYESQEEIKKKLIEEKNICRGLLLDLSVCVRRLFGSVIFDRLRYIKRKVPAM